MIVEYFRPETVEEAIKLLTDEKRSLKPLAGGTNLSRKQMGHFGVVDLQNSGLDGIEIQGQKLTMGTMVRLDMLLDAREVHPEIKRAIRIDAGENIRNMATLGGWLVSSSGRSILSTVLMALDATLTWEPDSRKVPIGDWFPVREDSSAGVLMTAIDWVIGPQLVFEYVARSPKDRPTLIVAAAQWASGRTRIALGGFGAYPILGMDGPDDFGADHASRNACSDADDQWATAEYRQEVASKLALRCLERLSSSKERED